LKIDSPYSLVRCKIEGQTERSVVVSGPGIDGTSTIGSRHARSDAGVLIIRVGDLVGSGGETTLLDPLAKSVLQFMRLLLGDDYLRSVHIRTLEELKRLWADEYAARTHVVLISHGARDGLIFLGEKVPAGDLVDVLAEGVAHLPVKQKHWLSLACLTGRSGLARPMSRSPHCSDFIGPYGSVHGAAASSFAQTFFVEHLLHGHNVTDACRRASRESGPGDQFRHWKDGRLR
jgi:hypothetical protein